MSHAPTSSDRSSGQVDDRPALGSRKNFWGEDVDGLDDEDGGHSEEAGTDEAEHLARRYVLEFVQPICTATLRDTPNRGFAPHFALIFDEEPLGKGSNLDAMHRSNKIVELTDPCFHLPKQQESGGRTIENRQHRLRRRYNEETGYINYGEPTGTGIASFSEEIYEQCIHNYLWDRYRSSQDGDGDGLSVTNIEGYVEHADRLWHDPSQDSLGSLIQFIKHVREKEDD
ncbi:hypothetical protein BVU17_18610 (plasmid) [Haloarcula taiwanensis]|uniref:Uncharacterized protein n=1 Tax=Haloarcula taiwanensis TaxID=1932004 RepID=A0A2H5A4D8_9EURY|nr:hypothetical protein [Haloarcula taiwanensis]AUG49584.1 hypothetical protein BVU17_18610 [Haloarcula taiwanensis]